MLTSDDAAAAFTAMRELAASPKQTVVFVSRHSLPAAAPDADRVSKWIADLGSDSFKVRQSAMSALLREEAQVIPLIDKALATKPALEVHQRLEKIREQLSGMLLTGEKLRAYRAVEVLDRIDTASTPDAGAVGRRCPGSGCNEGG